jgi:hypothetical protein
MSADGGIPLRLTYLYRQVEDVKRTAFLLRPACNATSRTNGDHDGEMRQPMLVKRDRWKVSVLMRSLSGVTFGRNVFALEA